MYGLRMAMQNIQGNIHRIWSKMRAYFILDFKPHLILAHVRFKNDYTIYPQNVSTEYGVRCVLTLY